jgi:hypothetical protein
LGTAYLQKQSMEAHPARPPRQRFSPNLTRATAPASAAGYELKRAEDGIEGGPFFDPIDHNNNPRRVA